MTRPEKNSYRYKVRGIYSTAISTLLQESKHTLIDPSDPIIERLSINNPASGVYDAIITNDRYNMAIRCNGNEDAVSTFRTIMADNFTHYFCVEPLINPYAIIVATQNQETDKYIKISLGEKDSHIKARLLKKELEFKPGKKILVTAKHPPVGTTTINFTADLTLMGNFIRLGIGEPSTKYSHFLGRKEQMVLSEYKHTFDFSDIKFPIRVYFRSTATAGTKKEIVTEFNQLKNKLKKILAQYRSYNPGETIYEGLTSQYFFLTEPAKAKCDQLRAKTVPTLPKHHLFRSLDNEVISSYINLLEDFIGRKPALKPELSALFQDYWHDVIQSQRAFDMYHWKPNGRYYHLGTASVESYTDKHLILIRDVSTKGKYDGLNVKKEIGDHIKTTIPFEGWWLKHSYFSADHVLKGIYVNINTPVEFSKDFIRYFDLIIDIIKRPNEPAQVIDHDELDSLVKQGTIPNSLKHKILKLSNDLLCSSLLEDEASE